MAITPTHDEIARLPLGRLARLGVLIECAVPWAKKTLFLVPGPVVTEQLVGHGVSRGRIWTAAEVADLLLAGVTREDAVKIAGTKVQFGGTVTGVARRETAASPVQPAVRPTEQLALAMEACA